MRLSFLSVLRAVVIAVAVVASSGVVEAARDYLPNFLKGAAPLSHAETRATLELIVFEVEGCHYCDVLRRDIVPRYQAGTQAKRAPLRIVDLNKVDTDKLALKDEVRMVPTVVLMRDGREFDRINGVVSLDSFFRLVQHMLDRVD